MSEATIIPSFRIQRHWIVFSVLFLVGVGGYIVFLLVFLLRTDLLSLFGGQIFWTGLAIVAIVYHTVVYLLWISITSFSFSVEGFDLVIDRGGSLFWRSSTRYPCRDILSIESLHTGVFSTLFGFGDLLIRCAGTDVPLRLSNISNINTVRVELDMIIRAAKEVSY